MRDFVHQAVVSSKCFEFQEGFVYQAVVGRKTEVMKEFVPSGRCRQQRLERSRGLKGFV